MLGKVLLLLALTAVAVIAKPNVVVDLPLGQSATGRLLSSSDSVVFRTTIAEYEPTDVNSFLEYDTGTTDPEVELCTYITWNRTPSDRFYDTAKCTNSSSRRTVIAVPPHLFASGDWYALVKANKPTMFAITAFNNTGGNVPPPPGPTPPGPTPPPPGCPAGNDTLVLDGPHKFRGYCYYLGIWGLTCDQVCGGLGGTNLYDFAKHTLTGVDNDGHDSVNCRNDDQPIAYFFNHGNKGQFTHGPGSTNNYATLGIGDKDGYYWCSCSACTNRGAGGVPGDFYNWHSTSRTNVCACFSD